MGPRDSDDEYDDLYEEVGFRPSSVSSLHS